MPEILLVDDDLELTELLAELLLLEGFNVTVVHNGQEALSLLKTQSFDLMLLDIMMPVLNGTETLKQLRKTSNMPVLMLSARDDDIDRVLGLELGADDYLPKPFNDRELVARIKAILRRSTSSLTPQPITQPIKTSNSPEEHKGKPLSFNGIELHSGRQQAIYNGQDLELTGTEFSLLQILIQIVNWSHVLKRFYAVLHLRLLHNQLHSQLKQAIAQKNIKENHFPLMG